MPECWQENGGAITYEESSSRSRAPFSQMPVAVEAGRLIFDRPSVTSDVYLEGPGRLLRGWSASATRRLGSKVSNTHKHAALPVGMRRRADASRKDALLKIEQREKDAAKGSNGGREKTERDSRKSTWLPRLRPISAHRKDDAAHNLMSGVLVSGACARHSAERRSPRHGGQCC